jgi:hypothetical protein
MTNDNQYPENVFAEIESMAEERPLALWQDQLKYVLRMSRETLQAWLEHLFEAKPFPILLFDTDPAVFAIYIYGAAPLVFQQRFRAAVKELVQSYHPQFRSVSYLGNLIYVCAQIRIIGAYDAFMELIYHRTFEGIFSTPRDEAAGHDVQSHLIAAAGTLRPQNNRRIINYCRRILEGEFPKKYGELAFQILSEFDEDHAIKYFGEFINSLAEFPESQKLDTIRGVIAELVARYGTLSLDGHVDRLLKRCKRGPVREPELRRARMLLYASLFSLRFKGGREVPMRFRQQFDEFLTFAGVDFTYLEIYEKIVDALKKVYKSPNLESVYEDVPITRAISMYARGPQLKKIEETILDESKFHELELRLLELATIKTPEQNGLKGDLETDMLNPLDPAGATEHLIETLDLEVA